MKNDDTLLSIAELDALAPMSWEPAAPPAMPAGPAAASEPAVAAAAADDVAPPAVAAVGSESDADDPLGGPSASSGVDWGLHRRMLALHAARGIPKTTKSMRKRYKMTTGTLYKVPDELTEAHACGYVHPDLLPPYCFRWVRRGGGYQLANIGG